MNLKVQVKCWEVLSNWLFVDRYPEIMVQKWYDIFKVVFIVVICKEYEFWILLFLLQAVKKSVLDMFHIYLSAQKRFRNSWNHPDLVHKWAIAVNQPLFCS